MGWLANKINGWASGKQEQELQTFVRMLAGMDPKELGLVAAAAGHARSSLEDAGHDVGDPILCAAANPEIALFLNGVIRNLQKQGQMQAAAAYMVWLHTVRGAIRPELRLLARRMWAEVARGFPHVEESATALRTLSGSDLDTRYARTFPIGFSPDYT